MRNQEQEEQEDRRNRRIGEFITGLGKGVGLGGLLAGELRSFRVRFPTEEDPGALLIVRARGEKGDKIAFVGAYNVGDAILAWGARDRASKMKWREDLPWEGKDA